MLTPARSRSRTTLMRPYGTGCSHFTASDGNLAHPSLSGVSACRPKWRHRSSSTSFAALNQPLCRRCAIMQLRRLSACVRLILLSRFLPSFFSLQILRSDAALRVQNDVVVQKGTPYVVFSCLTPAQFRRYSSFHLCPACQDGGELFRSARKRNLTG